MAFVFYAELTEALDRFRDGFTGEVRLIVEFPTTPNVDSDGSDFVELSAPGYGAQQCAPDNWASAYMDEENFTARNTSANFVFGPITAGSHVIKGWAIWNDNLAAYLAGGLFDDGDFTMDADHPILVLQLPMYTFSG